MLVYRSHLMQDYAELRLGQRIREARLSQRLTLRDLATRAKMSMPHLSRIENDHYVLNLLQALVLADSLGIPWESFLPADSEVPYQISRDAEVWSRHSQPLPGLADTISGIHRSQHNTFLPLADCLVGRHLEPLLCKVAALPDDEVEYYYHHEQAFAFVLKGTVELRIKTDDGIQSEEIHRGDCIYYRSNLPHCLRAVSSEEAEIIHVLSSLSAPFDASTHWPIPRPVSGTGPTHAAVVRMAEKLKSLREARGWTVAQVTRRAGLRERVLAQIENGNQIVRLDVALKLARAFSRPLHELIGDASEPAPPYFVHRATDTLHVETRLRRGGADSQGPPARQPAYLSLATGFPQPQMYPYLMKVQNPDRKNVKLGEHNGEEFCYVLEGGLELTTYSDGKQTKEILQPGDSLYIDSTVPHQLLGRSRNPYASTSAEAIKVFWCPLGEEYLFNA